MAICYSSDAVMRPVKRSRQAPQAVEMARVNATPWLPATPGATVAGALPTGAPQGGAWQLAGLKAESTSASTEAGTDSLPSYDEPAAALLIARALTFLEGIE